MSVIVQEASASMAEDYPTLAVAPEVSQTVPEQAPVVLRPEERSQSGVPHFWPRHITTSLLAPFIG